MKIECVGFDADDTIWECGLYYKETADGFAELMKPYGDLDFIIKTLDAAEDRNLLSLRYGAKALTISMIEAAIRIQPCLPAEVIQGIVDLGKKLVDMPCVMRPGALDVFKNVSEKCRVVIITKGDNQEQMAKYVKSPLYGIYEYIILHDKTVETYQALFEREKIDPAHFLMVGDSPKSDIKPILELGGHAAFIPATGTWCLEQSQIEPGPGFYQIESIQQVPDLLGKINR